MPGIQLDITYTIIACYAGHMQLYISAQSFDRNKNLHILRMNNLCSTFFQNAKKYSTIQTPFLFL